MPILERLNSLLYCRLNKAISYKLGVCKVSTAPRLQRGVSGRAFLTQKYYRNMSSENYRIEKQNAVYFLTFTVTDWVDVFTRLNYRTIIVESLDYCRKNKGLKLYA